VLCTKEVRDAAREEFEWSSAGRHKLKGLSSPVLLYRARRLDAGGDSDDATEPTAGRRRKRASS
jgi:class 3 adenylate cyclase